MNDLDDLVLMAQADFEQAAAPADLENAKARYLGKAGRLTELLKGLGALAADEKKTRGAAINATKQRVEAALAARRQALADAELERQLHAEALDVTLRRRGELRGCVGTLVAERPLAEVVRRHAVAAAFRDTRFEPLHASEFAELEVEVSLLEPMQPLPAASEADARRALRPGIDGLLLEWRERRATFLPQVWEQLPGPREFLAALKAKAGLPRDFWAADLKLSRYGVRKFVEADA